ncbi:MAG: SpoIID/LytB domain-containing protein [Hungatella sp.]|jgi:stage II sporulation protein D|nr:SpoIID/LytB domain-containing protein [Hungatella sp.]
MRRFWMFCLAAVLFPYVFTLAANRGINGIRGSAGMGNMGEAGEKSSKRVYLDGKGFVDGEEYLVGVVASQMPADYETEALKAQAVAARTFLYRQMGDKDEIREDELNLEGMGEEQMEKMWGSPRFLEYYEKVRGAVDETRGQVMVYEGEYIEPLFHRASAGSTRDGDEAHPYLASAESGTDMEMDGYLTVAWWTAEELADKVRSMPEGEQVRAEQIPDTIQVIERDGAGYVTQIQIGSHIFDGEAVRTALGLPSSAYVLEGYEDGVRAVCRGQGHGYGLSQYGAHMKAAQGMKAEEILTYYYKNIEIISGEQ